MTLAVTESVTETTVDELLVSGLAAELAWFTSELIDTEDAVFSGDLSRFARYQTLAAEVRRLRTHLVDAQRGVQHTTALGLNEWVCMWCGTTYTGTGHVCPPKVVFDDERLSPTEPNR